MMGHGFGLQLRVSCKFSVDLSTSTATAIGRTFEAGLVCGRSFLDVYVEVKMKLNLAGTVSAPGVWPARTLRYREGAVPRKLRLTSSKMFLPKV